MSLDNLKRDVSGNQALFLELGGDLAKTGRSASRLKNDEAKQPEAHAREKPGAEELAIFYTYSS